MLTAWVFVLSLSSIPSFHVTAKVSVNARDCCSSSAKRSTRGLGLCSFAVGVPPETVKEKIDIYRKAVAAG